MSYQKKRSQRNKNVGKPKITAVKSLLDVMEDGNEYESIVRHKHIDINFAAELRKSIEEIEKVRVFERPRD